MHLSPKSARWPSERDAVTSGNVMLNTWLEQALLRGIRLPRIQENDNPSAAHKLLVLRQLWYHFAVNGSFALTEPERTMPRVNVWSKVVERCCIPPKRPPATLVIEADSRDDVAESGKRRHVAPCF
jgi:hypothetical protein